MKLCFQYKTLRLSSNQDFCMKAIWIVNAQPVKYTILTPRWRVNKHGDPIFLLHFFNVHIMNVNNTLSFKKSLMVEQVQGNYVKK